MAITKTKSGTYRLRIYIPEKARGYLGNCSKTYEKRFKTKQEAKITELEVKNKINDALNDKISVSPSFDGDITFKDFYKDFWLDPYKVGQTTNTSKPPSPVTIENTESLFRLHILPIFGDYSLNCLNNNKQLVLKLLTEKSKQLVNFKSIKSYVNSVFNWAAELDFINSNKLSYTINRIKPLKKIIVEDSKSDEDKYLSEDELKQWLDAFKFDYENSKIDLKEYTLFMTTFILSDRKSESYALKWKDVDLKNSSVRIATALDRHGNMKNTKSNKKTVFKIPCELTLLLSQWKALQKEKLKQFNIIQNKEQLVFTYIDTRGNINKALHSDYLNYRMLSVRKRHPELVHCTPHKLRHTGASLAKKAGMTMSEISEALTHSDTRITKTYVNTDNIVNISPGELVYHKLILDDGVNFGVNFDKKA